ncbi:MAG: quinone-dependent dihydroorotate dehydrogenase [Chloroflexi bacterium]|nr:quinone-dependent dihydroorotate dehydrogenase [Chloroflexota bacterium]
MNYSLFRSLLFRLDPEQAHHLTLGLLRCGGDFAPTRALLRAMFEVNDPRLLVEAFGVQFKNPVGLAAGYDKNGIAVRGLNALGFGHIEVGTVTLRPQPGNPRPRIFRIPESNALINRMGFPSDGVDALKLARTDARIGVNIGKNKETPLERAADEYCELLRHMHSQADYVAINVSSPNTPGLRQLQSREAIRDLLRAVVATRNQLSPRVPLLVKIAPDLNDAEIDDVLSAIRDAGVDGVIATNTTLSRDGVSNRVNETGGLSGAPLRVRATQVIRYIAERTDGKLPIIGVGGIARARDAIEKLNAGAHLIQVYTGLVYRGPGLAREINRALLSR